MTLTTPAALAAEFAVAAETYEAKADQATRKTLADIQGDTKLLTTDMGAVDTGYLRSSVTWEMTGPLEGEVGPEAEYGKFVYEGTWKMAPRPALQMAAERGIPAYEQALAELGAWE